MKQQYYYINNNTDKRQLHFYHNTFLLNIFKDFTNWVKFFTVAKQPHRALTTIANQIPPVTESRMLRSVLDVSGNIIY